MDGLSLQSGDSKTREKQKGTDENGLEQRRGKFLAGELQRHVAVGLHWAWDLRS